MGQTVDIANTLRNTDLCLHGLSIFYVVGKSKVKTYLIDVDRMRQPDDVCNMEKVGTLKGLDNLIAILKGDEIAEIKTTSMTDIITQLNIGKD